MKKVYIIYAGFILAIFFSTIAIGQITVFEDNFDSYIAGQQISCQSDPVWKTWTDDPCNATEDAYVSNVYSFSGANSVVIIQNNDIVREIGTPINSGVAEINFQVFIPTGKAGYFNTLASFAPPNYTWAMQVFFNSTGSGTLDAGGANAATFNYPQGQWFPIKVVADLTANVGEFWLNGAKIHSWIYTLGTFGTTIPLQLDGNDFYGYSVNDEMYIDDYNIVHTTYTNKTISTPTGGNWNSGSTWVGGIVPNQNRIVEIVVGATVTLTNNRNRNATTIVNGTLNCQNYNLTGSGNFVISSGATLQIGSALGITQTGASGNIQVSGARSFNQFANYIYNGLVAQATGNGLPLSVKTLSINNAHGVTLSANTSVSGTLELINGNLLLGAGTLTLGTSITNLGTLSITSGKSIGNFNRWISNSANVVFPVGPTANEYTPVILSNVIGSGTFLVSAIDGIHPNATSTEFLQMYWKLTNGGITSADVEFHYLDTDVVGDEDSYELYRFNGSLAPYSPFNLNTSTNVASVSGLSSFSDWTLGFDNPLPVELTLFTANLIGKSVKLNWQTKTEVNNYGFEIERKILNQVQNDNWQKIGFVNGNGNSNSPKNYLFEDHNFTAGKYQYRLKQIDNDGQYEYSSIINVELGKPSEFVLEQNYPNPFNPNTKIGFSIPEASNVKIIIYNLIGEEISTLLNESKDAGYHSVNFNASNLNSGIYLYKIEAGTFLQTKKMTLIK